MLGREDILGLVPHRGGMCLLDHVLAWDDTSVLVSSGTHRSTTNPLRLNGRLRAILLCEYGAQAMAVHGGLLARAWGAPAAAGLLVSLRDVSLHVDYLDDLSRDIQVHARRLLADRASWQYTFRATHESALLAEGRAAVISIGPP